MKYCKLKSMKSLLEKEDNLKPLKVGQIIDGKIIGRGRSALFLDISPFGTGIIYGKEFYDARDELRNLDKGATVSAKVVDLDNEDGYIELSASDASQELAWGTLEEKRKQGELLTVKILGANRGGLLSKISSVPAFLPVSQLKSEHYPRIKGADSNKILEALKGFIGQELEVKIFDLSQKEGKLILSEKAKESEKIKEILKNYKVGNLVKATVTGITDFGAFVNFGQEKLEGLIHISELDWAIVENPSKIVKMGQEIEVKIIEISNNKVFLSLKAMKKDPWQDVEKKYKKGDIIKGKAVKFNPFGVFVQVEEKIQGLAHVSEFGSQEKMKEVIKIGEKYNFKVLSIEPKEHKITLAL